MNEMRTAHTCLTSAGSPVCAGCRDEREAFWEMGAELAQRADWERERYQSAAEPCATTHHGARGWGWVG